MGNLPPTTKFLLYRPPRLDYSCVIFISSHYCHRVPEADLFVSQPSSYMSKQEQFVNVDFQPSQVQVPKSLLSLSSVSRDERKRLAASQQRRWSVNYIAILHQQIAVAQLQDLHISPEY